MRALITNDDGIGSEGLRTVAAVAVVAGLETVVVAPSWDSSGASASLTAVLRDGRLGVTPTQLQAPGEPGLTGPVAQLLEVEVVRIVAGRPQIVEAADGRLVPQVPPRPPVAVQAAGVGRGLLGVETSADHEGEVLELDPSTLGHGAHGAHGLPAAVAIGVGVQEVGDHHEVVGVAEGVGHGMEPLLEGVEHRRRRTAQQPYVVPAVLRPLAPLVHRGG